MVNWIIRWSLGNRLAIIIVSSILLVAGAFLATTMPVDVFPDLTAPTVTILCEGRGMAPDEMETLVTFPIEAAVNGAANIRRVRSATAVGIGVVWVEFEWGTDIYRARQTVNERLATLSEKLPPQVDTPVLAPISSVMGEILFISLTSDRHDLMDLRTLATTDIRRRLLSVPGVSQVTPIGGEQKQYQVVISPARLRAFDFDIDDICDALRDTNENVSAGFTIEAGEEYIVQGFGRIRTIDDISKTVISLRNGVPVRVADVGVVRLGAAIRRGTGAASRRDANWKPIIEQGVIIAIQKQPGANTLELTRRLESVLEEIQASLPAGMFINKNLFKQSSFIEASLNNTLAALLDGGALVIVIVSVFLWSVRGSLITLLAIPLSLVTTIIVLYFTGGTINTMTLGGMAIAIGELVDDAIIDVENVVRRLRENASRSFDQQRPALEIIFRASVEVRASVVFASFIILLVFSPIFFLSGVEGRLLRPLGIAYCLAIAASLATALVVTPVLCYYLFPGSKAIQASHDPWIVLFLKRMYAKPLQWALRHPWLVLSPTMAAFLVALFVGATRGRGFLPEFNEGAMVIGLVTLPGTSLEESDALAHVVETTLMQHPEIAAIGRRTGRAEEDEHVQGVEASEIDLTLDMDAPVRLGKPRRSKAQLLEALRRDVALIPGIQATFGQPISHRIDHMLSGTRAGIAVKIFGEDLTKLRELAKQVEGEMGRIPGVVDLSTEQQVNIPVLRVDIDRDAIVRHGLRVAHVARALEAAFRGTKVSTVIEGRVAFDLVLRVGPSDPDGCEVPSIRTAGDILVDTPNGPKVPLKALARISEDRGPNFISRENVRRKIVVMCNVAGRALSSVVGDIRTAVTKNVQLLPGYYVEYGGQFESAEQTSRVLAILAIIVVLGIGFLLHVVFGSMRDALLIMINLPLALIGGIMGVVITGGVMTIATTIGFISLFGIAVRNGIMLVSHVRHLQKHEGVTDFVEAVRRGSLERLAPIAMTALAAGLAMIPLAMAREKPGTEILSPMALVIVFGLLSSTVLNMLIVPALLVRFGKPTLDK
ncbi:MAG: efflux RND transporter permease subunit [Planctomycetes bacterium]|nr:efflux RND transporter permease subunit [Planctomycetota bacterium]